MSPKVSIDLQKHIASFCDRPSLRNLSLTNKQWCSAVRPLLWHTLTGSVVINPNPIDIAHMEPKNTLANRVSVLSERFRDEVDGWKANVGMNKEKNLFHPHHEVRHLELAFQDYWDYEYITEMSRREYHAAFKCGLTLMHLSPNLQSMRVKYAVRQGLDESDQRYLAQIVSALPRFLLKFELELNNLESLIFTNSAFLWSGLGHRCQNLKILDVTLPMTPIQLATLCHTNPLEKIRILSVIPDVESSDFANVSGLSNNVTHFALRDRITLENLEPLLTILRELPNLISFAAGGMDFTTQFCSKLLDLANQPVLMRLRKLSLGCSCTMMQALAQTKPVPFPVPSESVALSLRSLQIHLEEDIDSISRFLHGCQNRLVKLDLVVYKLGAVINLLSVEEWFSNLKVLGIRTVLREDWVQPSLMQFAHYIPNSVIELVLHDPTPSGIVFDFLAALPVYQPQLKRVQYGGKDEFRDSMFKWCLSNLRRLKTMTLFTEKYIDVHLLRHMRLSAIVAKCDCCYCQGVERPRFKNHSTRRQSTMRAIGSMTDIPSTRAQTMTAGILR